MPTKKVDTRPRRRKGPDGRFVKANNIKSAVEQGAEVKVSGGHRTGGLNKEQLLAGPVTISEKQTGAPTEIKQEKTIPPINASAKESEPVPQPEKDDVTPKRDIVKVEEVKLPMYNFLKLSLTNFELRNPHPVWRAEGAAAEKVFNATIALGYDVHSVTGIGSHDVLVTFRLRD